MPHSLELSADFVDRAALLVERRAGLVFDTPRRSALETGLRLALSRAGVTDPERYLALLGGDSATLDGLLAEITVGETYFFRDPNQLELVRDRILPDLFTRRSGAVPLRIWSAACASGEEPYSLAILLHQLGALERVRIIGTDVSRPLLRRAREAKYGAWSLRGVPEELVRRYFTRSGGRLTPLPEIRAAVEFAYLNLAAASYPSAVPGILEMDLILCRNVLIYFSPDAAMEVGVKLAATLADDGWLVLGSADPLLTDVPGLQAEVTAAGLVYRRASRAATSFGAPWTCAGDGGQASFPPPLAPFETAPEPVVESSRAAAAPAAGGPPPPEAEARYAAGDYRGAAEAAALELEHGPDHVGLWLVLIRSLMNSDAPLEAETVCRRAREHHPTSAELAVAHAFTLLHAGGYDGAVAAARQSVYLEPESPTAHLALGTALLRLQDEARACLAFRNAERLLAAVPADTPVRGAEGEVAGRLRELAAAQLALLDPHRTDPGC